MWESYLENLNKPTYVDRVRLENLIQGKLPDSYWQLVCEHQGDTLEASLALEQEEINFGVLLLLTSPG